MRSVFVPPLDRSVSALGFGCASLGSRIAPASGLRVLAQAFEMGVTWYDVAPSYGDGTAEAVLGRFLQGRRDRVVLCTKVGKAPPRGHGLMNRVSPVIRTVLQSAPGLRGALRRVRPSAAKLDITPELVASSLSDSLRRLNTDYVDVLALHEPTIEEAVDPAVHAALHELLKSGRVRAIAVSSDAATVLAGVLSGGPYTIAQISGSPFTSDLDALAVAPESPAFKVSFGMFGIGGALSVLKRRLATDPIARSRVMDAGYVGPTPEASLLLDYAFARNPHGVVLASMFSGDHLRFGGDGAAEPLNPLAVALVDDLFAGP